MRMDGIEKEIIILNPYRKPEIDLEFSQSFQNNKSVKAMTNQNILNKEIADNTKKVSVSQEELNKMMEELKHKFSMLEKYLQIDIDQQLQIPISKIIDMKTEEVIRQIPPDWIVEILRRMEELRGVFYSREA